MISVSGHEINYLALSGVLSVGLYCDISSAHLTPKSPDATRKPGEAFFSTESSSRLRGWWPFVCYGHPIGAGRAGEERPRTGR